MKNNFIIFRVSPDGNPHPQAAETIAEANAIAAREHKVHPDDIILLAKNVQDPPQNFVFPYLKEDEYKSWTPKQNAKLAFLIGTTDKMFRSK